MDSNSLQSVSEELFDGLEQLEAVDLSNNRLSAVPETLLLLCPKMTKVSQLKLDNNPWSGDAQVMFKEKPIAKWRRFLEAGDSKSLELDFDAMEPNRMKKFVSGAEVLQLLVDAAQINASCFVSMCNRRKDLWISYIDKRDVKSLEGEFVKIEESALGDFLKSANGSKLLLRASSTVPGHHCVPTLLKFGCNIDAADEHGNTSLHIASMHHNKHLIEILLGGGAQELKNHDGLVYTEVNQNKKSHKKHSFNRPSE
eukprot:TRINITY_DN13470_c0_g1_i1.p1 TRINITY_DN13470_c0_g1~~TRINITY_DN13470_c0_g1_i1.p1  ORF type:complete len:255 (+),score=82.79 TRINITY_DN13470_c0_g1_i1:515-1279(+)